MHALCGPAVPPSAFAHVFALSDALRNLFGFYLSFMSYLLIGVISSTKPFGVYTLGSLSLLLFLECLWAFSLSMMICWCIHFSFQPRTL